MKLSFPVTLLLSVASALAQQSSLQFPKSSVGEVQSYSLEANTFIDALLKLSARFQFPLGVEWVKSADTLKPFRFSQTDRKSTRLNSSHLGISYAVFCL